MLGRLSGSGALTWKAIVIGLIVLLLLVPLMMLRALVSERSGLREQAYERIAAGWGGNSVVGGPMLIIPTERYVIENNLRKLVRIDLYLLPATLHAQIDMKLESEPRYVGIYAVPVYLSSLKFTGRFERAALAPYLDQPDVTYRWDQVRLRVPLSDSRGLREVRRVRFATQELKLGPGAQDALRGVEAKVTVAELQASEGVDFELDVVIAGSRALSIIPVGSNTSVVMQANWPHPSFQGEFLPVERHIDATGFDARWQVIELNRTYAQAGWETQITEGAVLGSALGVGLYQAVDVYQRAERAIKYALLFIALTFLTFFAWEQISGIRLHPLQYVLVGLALSMFYVLLIALSEHLAFLHAYMLAAAALVVLMGVYIAGALRSSRRGLIVAGAMLLVYGVLYTLILSEDYALLLGAIALFVALAAVMIATRKIDWYRLGREVEHE